MGGADGFLRRERRATPGGPEILSAVLYPGCLGAVVACVALLAMPAAALADYSLGLVFEFHNGFPGKTEVKVVGGNTNCATIHPSHPTEAKSEQHRISLGSVEIHNEGVASFSF